MSERQPVDWGQIRARPGQWACPVDGIVVPRREVVPACPHCLRAAHQARTGPNGHLEWVEPAAQVCGCPERHPAQPGGVVLGTWACSCSPTGIHRTWTIKGCNVPAEWPPHDATRAAPFYGPGSTISSFRMVEEAPGSPPAASR